MKVGSTPGSLSVAPKGHQGSLDRPRCRHEVLIFLGRQHHLEWTLQLVTAREIMPRVMAERARFQPVHPAVRVVSLAGSSSQADVVGLEAASRDARGRADRGFGHHIVESIVIVVLA